MASVEEEIAPPTRKSRSASATSSPALSRRASAGRHNGGSRRTSTTPRANTRDRSSSGAKSPSRNRSCGAVLLILVRRGLSAFDRKIDDGQNVIIADRRLALRLNGTLRTSAAGSVGIVPVAFRTFHCHEGNPLLRKRSSSDAQLSEANPQFNDTAFHAAVKRVPPCGRVNQFLW